MNIIVHQCTKTYNYVIYMHQKIKEILESTKKRIPVQANRDGSNFCCRDFRSLLESRKQNGLVPVIAEVKPSSPTRFIRNVTYEGAAVIAGQMQSGGAAAISVLTEPQFFKGSI
ncbi:MAG TPA: hypothetical protein VIO11_06590, partial [Candidatus Methanoperedens sp.]